MTSEKNRFPTLEFTFKGNQAFVSSVHFSPCMRRIVSGGDDNSVMVWHMRENKNAFRYCAHKDKVTCVRFSPTAKLIASSSKDRTVRLWIPNPRGDSCVIKAHSNIIQHLEFFHDGLLFATASCDKSVKLWATKETRFVRSFVGHNHWVNCVSVKSDNKLLASTSADKSVKIWDVSATTCIKTFEDLSGEGLAVSFQPTNHCLAASFSDGTIRLWDLRTHRLLQLYQDSFANSIDFHPMGHHLLAGNKILDLLEGKMAYTVGKQEGPVSFCASGEYFVSGDFDQVLVWKTNCLPNSRCKTVKKMEEDKTLHMPSTSSAIKVTVTEDIKGNKDTEDHTLPDCLIPVSTLSKEFVNVQSRRLPNQPRVLNQIDIQNNAPKAGFSLQSCKTQDLEDRLKSTECTVRDLVSQVDLLVQTVGLLEKRLGQMEDRFDQILSLNQQLLWNLNASKSSSEN